MQDAQAGLREAYEADGLVLVLGAGVSLRSDIPDWKCLLIRVAENRDHQELADELRAGTIQLPVAASVLQKRIDDRTEFVETVREALYRDLPPAIRAGDRDALVEHVRGNTTMRAVAAMCVVPDTKRPGKYEQNERIDAVATFNVDALFQTYVRARYGPRLLRTTERASAGAKRGKTSIYHLHGHLRFDRKARDPKKEASEVVLTEQDYFDFFNDSTSVFTYTFLYLLRERPCVFVGLSLEDGNLRRLLHLSAKERRGGYRSEGETDAGVEAKVQRHFAFLLEEGSTETRQVREDALSLLGTRVIWVQQFEEIDDVLGEVYGRERWARSASRDPGREEPCEAGLFADSPRTGFGEPL